MSHRWAKTGSTALFQPYISPTCYTENGEREAVEDLKGHVPPPKEKPWTCLDQILKTSAVYNPVWAGKWTGRCEDPLVPSRWEGPQYNGAARGTALDNSAQRDTISFLWPAAPTLSALRHFSGAAQQQFSALYKSAYTATESWPSWTQLSGDVLIYPPASHQQCLQDDKHIELELQGSPCTLCGFCKIHNNQFYTDRFPETSRIVNDWQWSFFRTKKKKKKKELGGKFFKCILCS